MKVGSNRSDAAAEAGSAVVVFDGVCALCNRWVRFLLRFDRRERYRFAAMQGQKGSAMLRVLAGLGGAWRLAGVLRLVPRGWRDAAYRALARNRYRWFGRHDTCHLPAPEQAARFLD